MAAVQHRKQAMAAAERATISVIVPVLNEAGILSQTLRCLQPLRQHGHEVIVVDGGNTIVDDHSTV